MFKLQFTNSRGQSIEMFGAPFRLSKVEGLGEVGADIQTQKSPYQDGETYIDSVLEPRYMSIELKIYGKDAADIESKRRLFASVFNPKLGLGTLKYVRGDEIKVINVIAESIPSFPDGPTNRGATFQKALLFLKAPSPYWRTSEIIAEPAFEPRFEFPFDDYDFTEMGMQLDERIIHNDGDAPAPIQVNFYGPADSPIIKNLTTGEFIRINRRLEEGETFKIDTSDNIQSLTYIDVDGIEMDVFHWIDLNSTFFKLELGDNRISCLCAISNNQKDFEIFYSKHYSAV